MTHPAILTAELYRGVIADVIAQVRPAFVNASIEPDVLEQLKREWESKVMETGALSVDIRSSVLGVGQSLMFDLQLFAQGGNSSFYPQDMAMMSGFGLSPPHDVIQLDGDGSMLQLGDEWGGGDTEKKKDEEEVKANDVSTITMADRFNKNKKPKELRALLRALQVDGGGGSADDSSSDEDDEEDGEIFEENPVTMPKGVVKRHAGEGDNNNETHEELNSDDDESDAVDLEELYSAPNTIICQFEKVAHQREKWKFQLKDGVMNVAGKDTVFHKCQGDAEW